MERWFYVRTVKDAFGLGSTDGVVHFVPEHLKWMIGKTLAEVKPYILEHSGKAVELKSRAGGA